MVTYHKKTIRYYEWDEVEDAVNKKTGKQVRNWAGKTFGKDDNAPYQDFWHVIIDYLDDSLQNPCYVNISFEDIKEIFMDDLWVQEICDGFIAVLGTKHIDEKGFYSFHIWW